MRSRVLNTVWLLVALLVLTALPSNAQSSSLVQIQYVTDPGNGIYRTAVAANDPANFSTPPVGATQIVVGGKPNLRVGTSFSVSGASCQLVCVRGHLTTGSVWVYEGYSLAFATSSLTFNNAGRFVAQDVEFDTGGAQLCVVLVEVLSSGNVTLYTTRH